MSSENAAFVRGVMEAYRNPELMARLADGELDLSWVDPEIEWDALCSIWRELSAVDPSIAVHLEIDAKYDVYLKRQTADVDAFRRDEGLVLTDIDYADVPGLSNEARAKLEAARPRTVGQAGRLDGLTPAALGILAAYLRREARR